MKSPLFIFGLFILTFVFSCKSKTVSVEKEIHLCETTDTVTASPEVGNLYDDIVTKDTIEAITMQLRDAFRNRRTLSYDEQAVEDYFNENFSKVLSFERFKELLPDANLILNMGRWVSIFPIRIGVMIRPDKEQYVPEEDLYASLDILNAAFLDADVQFEIVEIDTIETPFTIENLKENNWGNYFNFSKEHDQKDTINLYLFDNDENLCEVSGDAVICSRTGGFSYILATHTNNIVLTKFEIGDQKVIAHEFGHFFGLYHTFEQKFGPENGRGDFCNYTGDKICDTPADPGTAYEVYVNYTRCQMEGLFDEEGVEYQPMINNFMSYYKPCYMKPYRFSQGQFDVIYNAAQSDIRKNFVTDHILYKIGEDVPIAGN